MDLNLELWNEINSTPGVTEATKTSLHTRIMRLIEQSKATPAGKKHGATIMTQAASMAADKTAANRNTKPLAGDAKPKSI